MLTWLKLLGAVAALVITPILIAFTIHWVNPNLFAGGSTDQESTRLSSSTVKVMFGPGGAGTGSAVHIGGGYLITAAHVATYGGSYKIKLRSGQVKEATVLWHNTDYDVALMHTDPRRLASTSVSCTPSKVGDTIMLMGNPLQLEFVETHGVVSGDEVEFSVWKSVQVIDVRGGPGMSGGGVYNTSTGKLVGILVGGTQGQRGPSSAFPFMVPSTVICKLLARY